MLKKLQVIISLEKYGLILHFNFLQKNIYVVKNRKSELIISELSLHKYFLKKYKIKINLSKCKIRTQFVIFSAFLKKVTMTKSNANFLTPKANGQDYYLNDLSMY